MDLPPEVLDLILRNLQRGTFLRAQQVSKFWKATIENSSRYRKIRFLQADGAPLTAVWNFRAWMEPSYTNLTRHEPTHEGVVRLNMDRRCAGGIHFDATYLSKYMICVWSAYICSCAKDPRPWRNPDFEPYLNTFLTQPPITSIHAFAGPGPDCADEHDVHTSIYNRSGLRYSDLYDYCERNWETRQAGQNGDGGDFRMMISTYVDMDILRPLYVSPRGEHIYGSLIDQQMSLQMWASERRRQLGY